MLGHIDVSAGKHKFPIGIADCGDRGNHLLLEGLIGEAMVMDFSQEELREAFDKKLSQCQWNSKKGADSNNEPKNSTCDQPQRTQRAHRKVLVMIPNQRTDSPAG